MLQLGNDDLDLSLICKKSHCIAPPDE
jgi:hypothetical protein